MKGGLWTQVLLGNQYQDSKMNSRKTLSVNRRQMIQMTGVSTVVIAVCSKPVLGEDTDANVRVQVPEQFSDGESILIESLESNVDGRLQVFKDVDERPVYKSIEIDAGTEFHDRVIDLDDPIPETQSIRISVYPRGGGRAYDGMSVNVIVSESADGATPLDETDYGTEPGVQKIEADHDAGFYSPYFLYTPTTSPLAVESVSNSRKRPLLVEAYPWGDDFEERIESASGTIEHGLMRTVADATNCPVLVTPLPLTRGFIGLEPQELTLADEIEISYPRRDRVDRQFIAMIEDAKTRLNSDTHSVAEKIHYAGGSSAADFIDRIAPLYPEFISVISAGANGYVFLPFEEITDDIPVHGDPERTTIPYPIGAGNLEELTGEKFNRDVWMNIEQFRWIGAEDQDPEDPENYTHKRFRDDREISQVVEEIFGTLQVDDRFETSREIYDHLDIPATFTKFEGQGHVPDSKYMQGVIDFHQQQVDENFELIHVIPQQPDSDVSLEDSLTVTVTAINRTALESATTVSLAVDGTEVKTTEVQVRPNSEETLALETAFEDTGEFTLSVNGTEIPGSVVVTEEETDTEVEDDTATEEQMETSSDDASTDDDSAADESDTEGEKTDTDELPGFGIIQAIAAVGGLGYLFKQKVSSDSEQS